MMRIFSISNYASKWENHKCFEETIKVLCEELQNDKYYHSKLNDSGLYSFYMDIDKYDEIEEDLFNKMTLSEQIERTKKNILYFKKDIQQISAMIGCEGYNINTNDIKWAYNENHKFGFHIHIPKLYGSLQELKNLSKYLSKENDKIDTGVYKSNQLFRLPNQSKPNCNGKYIIMNGVMKDFIPEYIQDNSQRIKKLEIDNKQPLIVTNVREERDDNISVEEESICIISDIIESESYNCLKYCSLDEKIKYIKEFCNLINPNRLTKEENWVSLCFILKNEIGDNDNAFEIFLETSRLDKIGFEGYENVRSKWDTHKYKKIDDPKKLGSLIDWVKKDNYDKFNKIMKQINKKNEKIMKVTNKKKEDDEFLEMVKTFELHCCKIRDGGKYIDFDPIDKLYRVLDRTALCEKYSDYTFGEKQISFVNAWTKYNNIRVYRKMDTYPKKDECPNDVFNLWIDFDIEHNMTNVEKIDELNMILNHIKILCNHENEAIDWFMKWIAFLFKYPWIKCPCPVIKSEQGAGKNMFMTLICNILGKHKYFETTNPDRNVWGQFNSSIANKYLVYINELSKKQTNDADGKIKGLITDKSWSVNQKMIAEYEQDSYHKFIVTTNNLDSIRLIGSDSNTNRRFCFIEASDELVTNYKYFEKLSNIIKDINVQSTVYNYFIKYPVDECFGHMEPPKTKYFYLVMYMNRSPFANWMDQYMLRKIGSNVRISAKECYDSYRSFCSNTNTKMEGVNQNKFCANILNIYKKNIEMKRANFGYVMIFNFDELNKECKMQQNLIFEDLIENEKEKNSNIDNLTTKLDV